MKTPKMKWLVIYSEDETAPETIVPVDFEPVLIREYVGKRGEEVYSRDYVIAQERHSILEEVREAVEKMYQPKFNRELDGYRAEDAYDKALDDVLSLLTELEEK